MSVAGVELVTLGTLHLVPHAALVRPPEVENLTLTPAQPANVVWACCLVLY